MQIIQHFQMMVLNFLKQKEKAVMLSLSLDYSIQSRGLTKQWKQVYHTRGYYINSIIRNKHKLINGKN